MGFDSQAPVVRRSPRRPTLGSPSSILATSFLILVSMVGAAALATTTALGPTTLVAMSPAWGLAFGTLLGAVAAWWALYLWLLGRLAGRRWQDGLNSSRWPLALLSLSLAPVLAVFLSGRLPYTLAFDPATQLVYRWLATGIFVGALLAQELVLLQAARGVSVGRLAAAGWLQALHLPGWLRDRLGATLLAARRRPIVAVALAGLLLVAAVQRWVRLDAAHPGDMDVMLSVTYTVLSWPPFRYYHDYFHDKPWVWVYNHLPLFPILLAPLYWAFENLLRLPTVWAAKLLIGLADLVVALLLFSQARGRWRGSLGLILAALWLLPWWVVTADDHPIAVAIAFALGAFLSVRQGWLCGLLLALGVATRNEIAFFFLPLAIHFGAKRGLAQTIAFLGAFGTALILIAAPFVAYDPQGVDFAMRRQLQRDAEVLTSTLSAVLLPFLDEGAAAFLRRNPSLLAMAINLLVALLALRDSRVLRVLVVAGGAYLLTLPLVHERYFLFAYSVGLLYTARYGNPLVAAGSLAAFPPLPFSSHSLVALLACLGGAGLGVIGRIGPIGRIRRMRGQE